MHQQLKVVDKMSVYYNMMGGRGMMGGYYWPIGIIVEIIIILVFLGVIYWLVSKRHSSESAEDILKKRYASGEIKEAEYNKLLKQIKEQ